jgi:hypothetical protein
MIGYTSYQTLFWGGFFQMHTNVNHNQHCDIPSTKINYSSRNKSCVGYFYLLLGTFIMMNQINKNANNLNKKLRNTKH